MTTEQHAHDDLIRDQFTRQAVPFAEMPAHSDDAAFRLLLEAAAVGPGDEVLDVACGPGLTTCALAEVARRVVGLDLTPAMIAQAEALARSKGLANVSWRVGSAVPLPYADASFPVVFTRYSFHHFLDPRAALEEMARVCSPGGRVVVVDVATSGPGQAAAYDEVEKLRDPSHVHAQSADEFRELFRRAGLGEPEATFYRLALELGRLLRASFPRPGDAERVRRLMEEDIGRDRLGVRAQRRGDEIHYSVPTVVLVGRKAA